MSAGAGGSGMGDNNTPVDSPAAPASPVAAARDADHAAAVTWAGALVLERRELRATSSASSSTSNSTSQASSTHSAFRARRPGFSIRVSFRAATTPAIGDSS